MGNKKCGGLTLEEYNHSRSRNSVVKIDVNEQNMIEGNLILPNSGTSMKGIVIFAHGSGSSRHSPRSKYVSQVLNNVGIATLVVDLLTPKEETVDNLTREHRFNIALLAQRLISCTDWILQDPELKNLKIGYFGASTGAAAALVAAAARPNVIDVIVSRGGRPDLAGKEVLDQIEAPTLLIVGENDKTVIELNQNALNLLTRIEKKKKLILIPNATHLFEEEGALEEVARRASGWFECFFLEK
ncbi:MAG: dienelactone hydrolase family protein [Nitrososphaeraceae archaeon]